MNTARGGKDPRFIDLRTKKRWSVLCFGCFIIWGKNRFYHLYTSLNKTWSQFKYCTGRKKFPAPLAIENYLAVHNRLMTE
jgi:hypothetical protein